MCYKVDILAALEDTCEKKSFPITKSCHKQKIAPVEGMSSNYICQGKNLFKTEIFIFLRFHIRSFYCSCSHDSVHVLRLGGSPLPPNRQTLWLRPALHPKKFLKWRSLRNIKKVSYNWEMHMTEKSIDEWSLQSVLMQKRLFINLIIFVMILIINQQLF